MALRPLALLFALGFAAPALAEERPPPSVSVVGEAEADVKPDTATLALSISVQKPTAVEAAEENARALKAVIDGLKGAGVAAEDIQTVGLAIYPEMTFSSSQKPSIAGYRADDSLNVKVRALERAGALAGAAVGNGALYRSLRFDVSDRARREDDLRAAAVENARHRAELYAKGAGMKLGLPRAIVAQGSNPGEVVIFPHAFNAASMRAGPSAEPPIEGKLITLRQSVDATFDLSPP